MKCDLKDKNACDDGCGGGLMTNAYKYLIESGGLEEESTYPYTGRRDECRFKPDKVAVRVVNFTNIPIDENQIAANLVLRGPLAGESPQKYYINEFILYMTPFFYFLFSPRCTSYIIYICIIKSLKVFIL